MISLFEGTYPKWALYQIVGVVLLGLILLLLILYSVLWFQDNKKYYKWMKINTILIRILSAIVLALFVVSVVERLFFMTYAMLGRHWGAEEESRQLYDFVRDSRLLGVGILILIVGCALPTDRQGVAAGRGPANNE